MSHHGRGGQRCERCRCDLARVSYQMLGSLSRGGTRRRAETHFPMYAERVRVARRRGRPRRRTRADVSSPRPRPQAVVTSRSPRPSGRGAGGSWEKAATRSAPTTAWGAAKCGRCAPAPPNVPPLVGAGRRDAPHAAEEPRQTRGEAPNRPWATGAGGRVCRAPAPCGRGTATGGARMARAPCARDHTHKGRGRSPAAPHTSDVPQPPLAARDNERRAHGPCAHASDANRRMQCRAA